MHHASRQSDRDRLNELDAAAWVQQARAGDFAAAWAVRDRILDRGHMCNAATPRHLLPVWNGTPLRGKRVLIRCYHGLGDTVQLIRYAPLVRAIASDVTVWAQPSLLALLAHLPGIDRLLPLHDGEPTAEYDVDVELLELPWVFRTTVGTTPHDCPYLSQTALSLPGTGPRIGIVWRAGGWDQRRSIPFDQVTRLLDLHGCDWFRLQHDAELHEQHPRLAIVDTTSVTRTARHLRSMDLVITIDSLPAHLAGALAVPVWTLLPAQADWRWLEHRADSPWYPTMRLFRQREPGHWASVIDEVQDALMAQFPSISSRTSGPGAGRVYWFGFRRTPGG